MLSQVKRETIIPIGKGTFDEPTPSPFCVSAYSKGVVDSGLFSAPRNRLSFAGVRKGGRWCLGSGIRRAAMLRLSCDELKGKVLKDSLESATAGAKGESMRYVILIVKKGQAHSYCMCHSNNRRVRGLSDRSNRPRVRSGQIESAVGGTTTGAISAAITLAFPVVQEELQRSR